VKLRFLFSIFLVVSLARSFILLYRINHFAILLQDGALIDWLLNYRNI